MQQLFQATPDRSFSSPTLPEEETMSRIVAIDPATTQGKTRENLDAVGKMLGGVPNMFRVAANAPAALESLVALFGATAHGTLRAPVREAIALAVAEFNRCDYCLSAHSALGRGAGLTDEQMAKARKSASSDPKIAAILGFVRTTLVERGQAGESAIANLRKAGLGDGEILEVITNVALNVFTNYLNIAVDTDIDFPAVRAGQGL
jgi:uncharacterized peroxidase-related enzyme